MTLGGFAGDTIIESILYGGKDASFIAAKSNDLSMISNSSLLATGQHFKIIFKFNDDSLYYEWAVQIQPSINSDF